MMVSYNFHPLYFYSYVSSKTGKRKWFGSFWLNSESNDRKGACSTLQGLLNLEVTAAQLVRQEGNCAPAGAGRD